jgi:hypothetical protein
VAKIDHTFSMAETPEQAQAMFVRDIGSELHRAGEFVLCKEDAGRLVYSDGIVDPIAFAGRDSGDYAMLRKLTAHLITVAFSAELTGTTVSVSGHAERDIREAISRLGGPGHWPAIARVV